MCKVYIVVVQKTIMEKNKSGEEGEGKGEIAAMGIAKELEITVSSDGNICFLMKNGSLRYPDMECPVCHHIQELKIKKEERLSEKLYEYCEDCKRTPRFILRDKIIRDITWITIDRLVECEIDELYRDVRSFVKNHVDFKDTILYDVVSAWVFHTWFIELFDATTHILVIGLTKTGKTRALETLRAISYRGELGVSLTPASLFRSIDAKKITPFISEYQDLAEEERKEVDAIVKGGQKKGELIWRAKPNPAGDYETITFDPFTPMAIGTQITPREDIANRAFQISMSQSVRRLEKFVDYVKAKELLPQFLYLRYHYSREKLEEAKVLADAWLEKKKVWGREYERYLPLLTMFYACGINSDDFTKAIEYDTEHQREVARTTYDAIFVTELIKIYEEEKGAASSTIFGEGVGEQYLKIKTSNLREKVVEALGGERKISSQKIGLDLKRLQIQTKRYRDGTYIEEPKLLEKLRFYDNRFALGLFEEVEKPTLEALIYELVVEISMEDKRGALLDVIVGRIGKEYPALEIREKIDKLIEEGDLLINHRDDAGIYVVRG